MFKAETFNYASYNSKIQSSQLNKTRLTLYSCASNLATEEQATQERGFYRDANVGSRVLLKSKKGWSRPAPAH